MHRLNIKFLLCVIFKELFFISFKLVKMVAYIIQNFIVDGIGKFKFP